MILGIISDTHVRYSDDKNKVLGIPEVVLKSLKECNMIIHGGDIGKSREIIPFLSAFAPVTVVKGNHDKHMNKRIPSKIVTELEGWNIGIVHGHGDRIRQEPLRIINFFKEPLDILIFGHTHWPMVYADREVILLNPGSTSNTSYTPFSSFMTAALHRNRIEVYLNFLDEKRRAIQMTRKTILFRNEGVT